MSPAKSTKKAGGPPRAARKSSGTFTDDEREAMRERAREVKAVARKGARGDDGEGEREVLEKIAAMSGTDRTIGQRLHEIVMAAAPGIAPRLWYGMPAYARDGNVVCFYQCAQKFKARYATLGFSDKAMLDDGEVWPTAFAISSLTTADETRIRALVKKAFG